MTETMALFDANSISSQRLITENACTYGNLYCITKFLDLKTIILQKKPVFYDFSFNIIKYILSEIIIQLLDQIKK